MGQWTALLGQKYFRRFLTEKLALLATLVPNVAIHTFSFKLERAPPTIFNPWWMNGKKKKEERKSPKNNSGPLVFSKEEKGERKKGPFGIILKCQAEGLFQEGK